MNSILNVLLIVLALIIGAVVATVLLKRHTGARQNDQALLMLQSRLDSLMHVVDKKMSESHNSSLQQFSDTHRFMQDIGSEMKNHLSEVTKAVTEANEGSKQVLGITEELHNLQKVLTNQKHRGTLGEASLETYC